MSSFVCGVIESTDTSDVRIVVEEGTVVVSRNRLRVLEDALWGVTVPPEALAVGDRVAFSESDQALFLLAPNLAQVPPDGIGSSLRWSQFLDAIDCFFKERGFTHIKTPYLVQSPGVDHHIDFLSVTGTASQKKWTLPTSPEIHLKKSLCQGHQRIFEVKSCFRDDLPGPHHSVEFTMLEWYRAFRGLDAISEDVASLIEFLAPKAPKVKKTTMAELFEAHLGARLSPKTTRSELRAIAESHEIDSSADDDWNDLFFRLFIEKIEPFLGQHGPLIVRQFPPSQASLAQIDSEGWSARFEVYWKGVELANAFLEVNCPEENIRRFAAETEKRAGAGRAVADMDQDFFSSLQLGMPPAGGIAMGLDRLFKVCNDFMV